MGGHNFVDLSGQTFGRWKIVSLHNRGKGIYNCVCSCGTARAVYAQTIKSGASKSCGCYRNEVTIKMNKSLDHRAKVSRSNTGKKLSATTKDKLRIAHIGTTHTKETRLKLSISHSGDKSPLWRGGVTEKNWGINLAARTSSEYRQWRIDVFIRDNYTCQCCNKRGSYLHAHHINPFINIVNEYNIKTLAEAIACQYLWDINNGTTLCKKCHKNKHLIKGMQ